MKMKMVTYYEDGSTAITEFEKEAGFHPDSLAVLAQGLMEAERCGKKVLKIGQAKVNPFSVPPLPLVINESGVLTRVDILEKLQRYVRPMDKRYKSLFT